MHVYSLQRKKWEFLCCVCVVNINFVMIFKHWCENKNEVIIAWCYVLAYKKITKIFLIIWLWWVIWMKMKEITIISLESSQMLWHTVTHISNLINISYTYIKKREIMVHDTDNHFIIKSRVFSFIQSYGFFFYFKLIACVMPRKSILKKYYHEVIRMEIYWWSCGLEIVLGEISEHW